MVRSEMRDVLRGRVRHATERDLGRILEIDALSFEKTWDDTAFREAMKDLFLVFEEESVTGFLAACCRDAERDATIMKVAVHPARRGQGIASRLIAALLDTLRERGVTQLDLDVEIVKTEAIGHYERFGFRVVAPVHGNQEENEEFLIMRLDLADSGATAP